MNKATVAVVKTSPATVLEDTHRLLNLAGYQDALPKDRDTGLKINISWHFFYPGSSTTPWQLDGVIRAMKRDGFKPELIHNRSGVGSTVLAVDLNKDGAMDVVTSTVRGTVIFWGKPPAKKAAAAAAKK